MIVIANKLKPGLLIRFNGDVCRIIDTEHIAQGRGSAMVQTKMKNILTGANVNQRFRSDDKCEICELERRKMQYLYSGEGEHHFMEHETFEQVALDDEALGDGKFYLIPDLEIEIEYLDGNAVGVQFPSTVELEIVETDPNMKGATAAGGYKPAKLNTGLVIQVPPYLETGQRIKVDTRENTYLSKAD